jgi:hypothetical protein
MIAHQWLGAVFQDSRTGSEVNVLANLVRCRLRHASQDIQHFKSNGKGALQDQQDGFPIEVNRSNPHLQLHCQVWLGLFLRSSAALFKEIQTRHTVVIQLMQWLLALNCCS